MFQIFKTAGSNFWEYQACISSGCGLQVIFWQIEKFEFRKTMVALPIFLIDNRCCCWNVWAMIFRTRADWAVLPVGTQQRGGGQKWWRGIYIYECKAAGALWLPRLWSARAALATKKKPFWCCIILVIKKRAELAMEWVNIFIFCVRAP
jgi:hypothetical protein